MLLKKFLCGPFFHQELLQIFLNVAVIESYLECYYELLYRHIRINR